MTRPDEPRRVTFTGHDGLTLVGDAFGPAGAPPVILLPGGGQTRHAWGGTAAALARGGWYAVSLDLRGHGDSAWAPGGDYSMDAFVGDVQAAAADLGGPPAVVGASLGGITALLAQGDAPTFSAMVLVDIAPKTEQEGVQRIVDFMRAHLEGFDSVEAAAAAVSEYIPHRPRPKDLSGLRKNLRVDDEGRYRWHWDPEFVLGMRRPRGTERYATLRAASKTLTIPTLLVRGKLSDVISEGGATEFLQDVPHAEFVDVSGAGHMVAGDRNDAFAAAVIEFLARHGGPDSR